MTTKTNNRLSKSALENKAVVDGERASRSKECSDKIQACLDEYDCFVDVSVLVTHKGNIPNVNIVAK